MRLGVSALCASMVSAALGLGCGGQTLASNETYGGSGGMGAGGGAGGITPGGGAGGITPGGGGGTAGPCSLEVIAEGTLSSEYQTSGSGPGIVATDTGFVIGHRQSSGGLLNVWMTYVSDSGQPGVPGHFELAGCADKTPTDGVALAYAGGDGLLATSLPDCGAGAGAALVPFSSDGSHSNASGPKNATFLDLALARTGALAPGAKVGEYELLYRLVTASAAVVERVILQGPSFKNVPIGHPFGEADLPFGMIATTPTLRALLAPTADKTALELQVGAKSSDVLSVDGKSILPMSASPSLVAWDERVAVGVPSGTVLLLRVLERSAGNLTTIAEGGLDVLGSDDVRLAAMGDYLFVVSGAANQILLTVIEGASSTPAIGPSKGKALTLLEPGKLNLAVAAARGKDAQAWVSTAASTGSTPMGGWMLLSCEP